MNYQTDIEHVSTLLQSGKSNGSNPQFSIDVCRIKSNDWKACHLRTNFEDGAGFTEIVQSLIDKLSPDAIRVSTYINDRKNDEFIIKLTDTHIPLIDKTDEVTEKIKGNAKQPLSGVELGYTEQLRKIETDRIVDRYENDIRFMGLKHQAEIDKLNIEIATLKEKIEDLTAEAAMYAEEIEKLTSDLEIANRKLEQKSSEQQRAMTLGAVHFLGKAFNVEKDELKGLLGMIASDNPQESSGQSEKGGGLEVDEDDKTDPVRKQKITVLTDWMKSSSNEDFDQFWEFMMTITNIEGSFEAAFKAAKQVKSQTNPEGGNNG